MNLQDKSLFRQQCYIDGAWADADNGKTIDVNNPADNEVIGTVPAMATAETNESERQLVDEHKANTNEH